MHDDFYHFPTRQRMDNIAVIELLNSQSINNSVNDFLREGIAEDPSEMIEAYRD